MSSLVPITREFLREHYKAYPVPEPACGDAAWSALLQDAEARCAAVNGEKYRAPHKLDENFFRLRQDFEWIDHLAGLQAPSQPLLAPAAQDAAAARARVELHQANTAAAVTRQVEALLPQDWRLSILKKNKASKEKKNAAELDKLAESPGYTIDAKYDLLWKQQMDRRQSLADLGNASGMFKFVLKHIAGVPQVLLDFVKQINAPEGPMEEQRIKYGPRIYEMSLVAHVCRAVLETSPAPLPEADGRFVAHALSIIRAEVDGYFSFLYVLFESSPFFVTASQAGGQSADKLTEEIVVGARSLHEHRVEWFDSDADKHFCFSFRLAKKDIDFSVVLIPEGAADAASSEVAVLPVQRVDAGPPIHGLFRASFPLDRRGVYVLRWDNTYSRLTSKTVHFEILSVGQDEEDGSVSPAEVAEQ